VKPDGASRETAFGAPLPDDLPNPRFGLPYRGSESIAVTGGRVLIGMSPWAELFEHRSETEPPVVTRLLPARRRVPTSCPTARP
jgi:hypothetical protein